MGEHGVLSPGSNGGWLTSELLQILQDEGMAAGGRSLAFPFPLPVLRVSCGACSSREPFQRRRAADGTRSPALAPATRSRRAPGARLGHAPPSPRRTWPAVRWPAAASGWPKGRTGAAETTTATCWWTPSQNLCALRRSRRFGRGRARAQGWARRQIFSQEH